MSMTVRQLESGLASMRRDMRAAQTRSDTPRPAVNTPLDLARTLGIKLDDWQADALTNPSKYKALLVSRQGGKTEVGVLIALNGAINDPGSLGLVISKSDRQAKWLLDRLKQRYLQLPGMPPPIQSSAVEWRLGNGSRFIALPGGEDTIVGLAAVDRLLVDEAARVPDTLFKSVMPMLATTGGSVTLMSTARGKRGFFYDRWENGGDRWFRVKRTALQLLANGRITQEFLDDMRSDMGQFWFDQEFMCEFMDDESQMFATDLVLSAYDDDVMPLALPTIGGTDAESQSDGSSDLADRLSSVWMQP